MAKELSVLQQQAEAIKTEVNKGANTSSRIGGMFGDMLEYNEEQSKIDEGNTGVSEYPEFSEQEEYKSGDVIGRNGKLYEFKVEHPAGSWNETHVEATSIKKIQDKKLTELKNTLGNNLSFYFGSVPETPQGYIADYYINKDGNFVFQIQQKTYYWHVNEGDILRIEEDINKNYATYSFFDDVPNINSLPTSYYPYDGGNLQYVISPIDGYIAISGYYLSVIKLYKSIGPLSDIIGFNLCRKPIAYNNVATETIDGYYIKNTGEIIYQAGQYIKYLKVKKGDFVKITALIGTNYSAYALFEEEPIVSSKPAYFKPYTNEKDFYVIIPFDGYIASSSDKNNDLSIGLGEYKDINIIEYLNYYFYNSYNVVGTIDNYYFNNVGKFRSQIGQYCQYAFVKKGEKVKIMGGTNNVYAAWGFFKEIPTIESVPYDFVPYSIYNTYFTAPEDGYILGSADKSNNIYILKASERPNVKKYTGKTCIYIGDSISTLNRDCR